MTLAHESLARETVRVDLGERSYDILIGENLIHQAGKEIAQRIGKVRAAIVTDDTVETIHLETLTSNLETAGIEATPVIVPTGEGSKSYTQLEKVCDAVLAARLERGDAVIALGGGVPGDLAGFAAAIVRRGMKFIQIPTSLLAQVDSSVGGKTGINTAQGKNLLGAFYQPGLVLADTKLLDTLSERHFRAGYAEVAKYGLINDAAFFTWLEENWQGVMTGGAPRIHAVAHSCRAKAKIVAADETEAGQRALLNLGHTFGHALEKATGYSDRLVHGEGVAIGMVLAHRFSNHMNLASADDIARVESHLKTVGLPTKIQEIEGPALQVDELMDAIAQDKKVSRGSLTFILTSGIGEAFVAKDVPGDTVRKFLTETLTA